MRHTFPTLARITIRYYSKRRLSPSSPYYEQQNATSERMRMISTCPKLDDEPYTMVHGNGIRKTCLFFFFISDFRQNGAATKT
jgi:hypothetical protein